MGVIVEFVQETTKRVVKMVNAPGEEETILTDGTGFLVEAKS